MYEKVCKRQWAMQNLRGKVTGVERGSKVRGER